jgi:hypothetical protein
MAEHGEAHHSFTTHLLGHMHGEQVSQWPLLQFAPRADNNVDVFAFFCKEQGGPVSEVGRA